MKSIKEKADEYARCIANSKYTREDFVSGANYVLEEIEKLIYEKHVKGNLQLFDLTHLIDKLKDK